MRTWLLRTAIYTNAASIFYQFAPWILKALLEDEAEFICMVPEPLLYPTI
jgi:hypothetical protein